MAEALATMPVARTASAEIVEEVVVHRMARALGLELHRIAGNVYEAPASRDYWAIRAGKLVRLTGNATVLDDDEHLEPADVQDPESSLNRILADLEF